MRERSRADGTGVNAQTFFFRSFRARQQYSIARWPVSIKEKAMKAYEKQNKEVIAFDQEDVIVTSVTNGSNIQLPAGP